MEILEFDLVATDSGCDDITNITLFQAGLFQTLLERGSGGLGKPEARRSDIATENTSAFVQEDRLDVRRPHIDSSRDSHSLISAVSRGFLLEAM